MKKLERVRVEYAAEPQDVARCFKYVDTANVIDVGTSPIGAVVTFEFEVKPHTDVDGVVAKLTNASTPYILLKGEVISRSEVLV